MNFQQFLEKEDVTLPINKVEILKIKPKKIVAKTFTPIELFKKNDFVQVIRGPKNENDPLYRKCDIYKGYFGEIVEIKNEIANVRLEAVNNYVRIDVNLNCLIKRNN